MLGVHVDEHLRCDGLGFRVAVMKDAVRRAPSEIVGQAVSAASVTPRARPRVGVLQPPDRRASHSQSSPHLIAYATNATGFAAATSLRRRFRVQESQSERLDARLKVGPT